MYTCTMKIPPQLLKLYQLFQNSRNIIGITVLMVLSLITPLFGVGGDFSAFIAAVTRIGYGVHTWNPYPFYWLVEPFALPPLQWGFLLWLLLNMLGYLYAIDKFHGDFLSFSWSYPAIYGILTGQSEGIAALGLALGMFAPSWVAGIGIAFLSFKTHLGLVPIIFIIAYRRDWRVLIIPIVLYLASFLYWGWWIPEWLGNMYMPGSVEWRLSHNTSLFPWGLIFIPLAWFWWRNSLSMWLIIQGLTMPYYTLYSYSIVYVACQVPWWVTAFMWLSIIVNHPIPKMIVPFLLMIAVQHQLEIYQKRVIFVNTVRGFMP